MDKRLLASYPRPIVKKSYSKIDARYIITAQLHEQILVLNFFRVNGEQIYPEFRCFCQEDEYISQDLTTEKTKWKTATVIHQVNHWTGSPSYWWSGGGCVFAQGEALAKRIMARFLGIKNEFETGFKAIVKYQENILAKRLAKKNKKETDVIDFHMDKFGAVPDDYQTFTEKVVFAEDNYIFYNKKKKEAYCSKCGWDFDIDENGYLTNKIGLWNHEQKLHHNKSIRCPYCNSYLEAKSENMSRGQLVAVKWSVLVQSHGEEVLVRYFRHIKDFNGSYRKPNYYRSEQFRSVHSKEKAIDFEWNKYKQTDNIRWMYQRENYYSGYYWSPSEYVLPRAVTLYNTKLDEDLKGTCMQYSCAKEFLDWISERAIDPRYRASPWIVDRFLNFYRKNPWIEQLIKCNLFYLAYELMFESRYRDAPEIKSGRTICETLGINKNMLNILRKQKTAKYRDIQIMKYYVFTLHKDIPEKDFDKLKYVHDMGHTDLYKKFIDFMKYSTIHKLSRYLNEQKIRYPMDYFDYAGWLEELGYDMKNEFNLYPRDFNKAHDERFEEFEKYQEKKHIEEAENFNLLLQRLREEMDESNPLIKIKGLFIRLPVNLDELKYEGEQLHHCVGTYREKVAKGQTMIYFIRKEAEPDKPFYTLEYKDGKVVQCRGLRNCDMTPEVKAFVKLFEENITSADRKAG